MAAETPPEEAALHSSLPTVRFPLSLVMCQSLRIPGEPAPALKRIYKHQPGLFFCASSGSKDIPATF